MKSSPAQNSLGYTSIIDHRTWCDRYKMEGISDISSVQIEQYIVKVWLIIAIVVTVLNIFVP